MGAEFLVWRYRPALLVFIALFFVVFKVHLASAENAAPAGKIYPRGNHWAVGHLMGKKSTDNLFGSGENDRTSYRPLRAPDGDKQVDGYLQPSKLVRSLIRVLVGLQSPTEAAPGRVSALSRKREWVKRERDRNQEEVMDFLIEVFGMKDSNSS